MKRWLLLSAPLAVAVVFTGCAETNPAGPEATVVAPGEVLLSSHERKKILPPKMPTDCGYVGLDSYHLRVPDPAECPKEVTLVKLDTDGEEEEILVLDTVEEGDESASLEETVESSETVAEGSELRKCHIDLKRIFRRISFFYPGDECPPIVDRDRL